MKKIIKFIPKGCTLEEIFPKYLILPALTKDLSFPHPSTEDQDKILKGSASFMKQKTPLMKAPTGSPLKKDNKVFPLRIQLKILLHRFLKEVKAKVIKTFSHYNIEKNVEWRRKKNLDVIASVHIA